MSSLPANISPHNTDINILIAFNAQATLIEFLSDCQWRKRLIFLV